MADIIVNNATDKLTFLGGATFAREQSDQVGGGCGRGGVSPFLGRDLFSFFNLKMCNLGHT